MASCCTARHNTARSTQHSPWHTSQPPGRWARLIACACVHGQRAGGLATRRGGRRDTHHRARPRTQYSTRNSTPHGTRHMPPQRASFGVVRIPTSAALGIERGGNEKRKSGPQRLQSSNRMLRSRCCFVRQSLNVTLPRNSQAGFTQLCHAEHCLKEGAF